MQAEIVSIGTELMRGETINGNAAYLADRLSQMGIDVCSQTTVGDDLARICEAANNALHRAEIVVFTGGLGPTEDDLTRYALSEVTRSPLTVHSKAKTWLENWLRQRQKNLNNETQLRQCLLPDGAEALLNPIGSAPGIAMVYERRLLVALPGPPHEMSATWKEGAEDWLMQNASGKLLPTYTRQLMICGIGESDVNDQLRDLMQPGAPVLVAPYAKPGSVRLRISIHSESKHEAEKQLDHVEGIIGKRLGLHVHSNEGAPLEQTVGDLLRAAGLKISFAESCTGGLLGAHMTDIAGSSDYFLGSLVCYANELKTRLLGVDDEILKQHAAVSAETAAAMAQGAINVAGSDIACSVTGVAGPGESEQKPAGTVYFGLAHKNREKMNVYVWKRFLPGDRQLIRNRSVQEVLAALYFYLKSGVGGAFWEGRQPINFSSNINGQS